MSKIDEVHINFSNLRKNIPYTFILHNWRMGKRYRNFSVLFDASFESPRNDRIFKLCLPIPRVIDALNPIGMKYKRARDVKLTFQKLDRGIIDILDIQVVVE